jgi:hypothetical protein
VKRQKEEERRRIEEENIPDPYSREIELCDSLLHYLHKFLPTSSQEEQQQSQKDHVDVSSTSSALGDQPNVPAQQNAQGLKQMGKKSEETSDLGEPILPAASSSKSKKGKRGSRNSAAASFSSAASTGNEGSTAETNQRLVHTVDALSSFASVGVAVPQMTLEVQSTIETLNDKRSEFESLQKEQLARRETQKVDHFSDVNDNVRADDGPSSQKHHHVEQVAHEASSSGGVERTSDPADSGGSNTKAPINTMKGIDDDDLPGKENEEPLSDQAAKLNLEVKENSTMNDTEAPVKVELSSE